MVVKTNKLVITNSEATVSNVEMESSGADDVDVNKVLKLSNASSFAANGSHEIDFSVAGAGSGVLGPNAASSSDISKWLTVKDANGSTLYIPAWM